MLRPQLQQQLYPVGEVDQPQNVGCGRHSPAITAASAPVSCPGKCKASRSSMMARKSSRRPTTFNVRSILERVSVVISDVQADSSVEEQSHGLHLRLTETLRQIEPLFEVLGPHVHQEITSSLSEMLSIVSRLRDS